MYANGRGIGKDEAEAVQWYARRLSKECLAQTNLGVMYANGRGIGKDEAEAVRWYRKAAEQGYATAGTLEERMPPTSAAIIRLRCDCFDRWRNTAMRRLNTNSAECITKVWRATE